MIVASIVLAGFVAFAMQSPGPAPGRAPQQSPCAHTLADALTDGAASEICSGEEAGRLANAAPDGSAERTRQWEAAARHYRRASTLAAKAATKVLALNLLESSYDAQHLSDAKQLEMVLRELISLTPDDFTPVSRLAKV